MDIPEQEQQAVNSILSELYGVPAVALEIGAFDSYLFVSYLQLALQHPEVSKNGQHLIKKIARNIQDALASRVPEVGELLEKGWHREHDVPRVEVEQKPIACYSHLPKSHQTEVVANATALQLACRAISLLGGMTEAEVFEQICTDADGVIALMDEAAISQIIALMDEAHNSDEPIDDDHDNN